MVARNNGLLRGRNWIQRIRTVRIYATRIYAMRIRQVRIRMVDIEMRFYAVRI
jgi:hypothetical protein